MRRTGRLTLLVLALASWIGARDAHACSCIQPRPACQAYWTTDAVFEGSVTSITPIERVREIGGRDFPMTEYVVRFDVRQAWKGIDTGTVEILTTESGGLCGYDFKVAGRYLVFAHRRGTDGRLGASMCSLTRPYNGFDNDITPFLSALTAPAAAAGGRVFGSVLLGGGRFSTGQQEPMEIQVRLTGDGRTVAKMSTGGRYEFTDLLPARYEIDVTLPQGYKVDGFPRAVHIPNPRACVREDAWISPAGTILGRVVGPTGPADSVRVEITLADAKPNQAGERPSSSAWTRSDGTFEANEIPPGHYIVGINLRDTPTPSNRYERLLFHGAGRDGEAVAVAVGQVVDLGTLQIPAAIRVIKVSGAVTWQDGSPAADFSVFAHDGSAAGRFVSSARTGPDGRFTIELLGGRTYMLRGPGSPRGRIELPIVPFKVQDGMAPVSVVVPRGPSH